VVLNKTSHFILSLLLAALLFPNSAYSSDAHKKETGRDGCFIAYRNGTVMDTSTGLMWAARGNGEDINRFDFFCIII